MEGLLYAGANRPLTCVRDAPDWRVASPHGAVNALRTLNHRLPQAPTPAAEVLARLDRVGSPATPVTTRRYVGFLNGGVRTAAVAATWLVTGAWAHGQSLPVSDPYRILGTDPAAFVRLLEDARPSPVTQEAKEMVLRSLPREGEIRVLNASARGKLAALYPVLHATRRDGVYVVKIIDVPQAAVAIHGRAVILISEPALRILNADQLQAAVAHEAAHEYVWEDWYRAARRFDWNRLRELELICDGIAIVILHQLGVDSSALITGFEKMILLNLLRPGTSLKTWGHPTLDQRREFERAVAAWIASVGRGRQPRRTVLPLTVAIHDSAALAPSMPERATGVATEIYRRIGVSMTWVPGAQVTATAAYW